MRLAVSREAAVRLADLRVRRAAIKERFYALFKPTDNRSARGTDLEGVLNDFFALEGVAVRESMRRRGELGEGVIEQLDGVVAFDGHLYLVEMKWRQQSLGTPDVSEHLVRVYGRGDVRGLFISYSAYAPGAIATCRDALGQKVVALARLEEFVQLLEKEALLLPMLRAKVTAAEVDKQPWAAYSN